MSNRPTAAKPAVLAVGTDPTLLETRKEVLASGGYDTDVATPEDIDKKLAARKFNLVILSVLLGEQKQKSIEAKLPAGTKALRLEYLVPPKELLAMVARELDGKK
jgi:hypothetical protein